MDDIPLEASPEDVMEQRAELLPDGVDSQLVPPAGLVSGAATVPWDADPADVADQRAEVPVDDDWA